MTAMLISRIIPFLLSLVQQQVWFSECRIGVLPCQIQQASTEINGYEIEYFPVYGADAKELRAFLTANGPLGIDGQHYDAYTDWYISWKWPLQDRKPDLANVDVKSSIVVHLPEWKTDLSKGDPVYQSWLSYIEAVKNHEAGHVRQAQYHKKKLERLFKDLARQNPALTAKEANKFANGIIQQAHRADEFYDILTSHGALQGARWSPR